MGIRFNIGPDLKGSAHANFPMVVKTTVGFMLFVRMPYLPRSTAILLVIWFTEPLDAQYVVWSGIALYINNKFHTV